jgi:lipopolysaccharide export LptBFGC system permease protein LptF
MKIWQQVLLKETAKTFLFFLFSIFTIYVVVDLSVHGVRFLTHGSLLDLGAYYLYTFSTLFELFITLTFLLSVIRVLHDLTRHRELIALQMAGLSKKRFSLPLFWMAAFLSVLCFLNHFLLMKESQGIADNFRKSHKKKKVEKLHSFNLMDDTELVYQRKEGKELIDLFWVKNAADIWHMKSFSLDSFEGKSVHHFTRDPEMRLVKSESFPKKLFPELRPAQTKEPVQKTELLYKIVAPLIPFLVLFGMIPLLLRYTRSQPILLITACSLFAFIALKVILDGMVILGENLVLPATIAVLTPIGVAFASTLPGFLRMR